MNWNNTYRFYLIFIIVILIPFQVKLISIPIIAYILLAVIQKDFLRNLSSRIFSFPLLMCLLFYLFHVVGMIWTQNNSAGLFDLQVKLSLIIFPLFFLSERSWSKLELNIFNRSFLVSSIIAMIICLIRAIYRYDYIGESAFYYKEFSFFVHPSYFSMYLCFSIAILINDFIRTKDMISWSILPVIMTMMVVCVGIFLLSSKAGILILATILLCFLLILLIKRYYRKLMLVAFFIVFGGFIISLTSNTGIERMSIFISSMTTRSDNSMESTAARMFIWSTSKDIISENPIIGVGTGDVNRVLEQAYLNEGESELASKSLNAHNQFIQSSIALGFLGLSILVLLFTSMFVISWRREFFLGFVFTLIITTNAFVESIFEVQAGVLFFSLFLILLFGYRNQNYPLTYSVKLNNE